MDRAEQKRLIKALRTAGYEVRRGGNGHWQIRDGPRLVTTMAATGSDRRGDKNLAATLRRELGFHWPPRR